MITPRSPDGSRGPSTKLVIFSQYMYPERNSTGELLSSLASGLVGAGFEVTAYCSQPSYFGTTDRVAPRLDWQGVHIQRVWSTRFGRRRLLGRIIDNITFVVGMLTVLPQLPRNAVVLVVSNPPALPLVGALAKLITGTPVAVLLHDVYPDIAIQLGVVRKGGALHRIFSLVDRFVLGQADAILVLGRDMRRRLEAKVPARAVHRIHVIPNWADPSIRPIEKSQSRMGRDKALADAFVIQYSGNVGLSQGLEVIIDAAELLRDEKVVFSIVGEGLGLTSLQREVKERQLTNVLFLPRIEWSDLSDSLAACDAAIVPLKSGIEGLSVPSKYYTILAAGRPVLAVMGSEAEVALSITENDCGAVCPPGNAAALADQVREWKSNPPKLRELGRNARRAFERLYTRDAAVDRYVEVLNGLTSPETATSSGIARVVGVVRSQSVAPWLGLGLLAAGAWVLTVTGSGILIVVLGAIVLPLLILVRPVRLPFVVIGGLTILSSSHSLNGAKVFYLVGVFVTLVAALARLRSQRSTPIYISLRPLLITSAVWFAVIGLSALVGLAHGNAMVDWLRDSAPYLLLCSVPVLALDAYGVAPSRTLPLFMVTSCTAALSFVVYILARRQIYVLPIDHVVAVSALLPIALYCFATSHALLERRNRLAWAAVSVILLSSFLASGSRTYVVLLAAPVAIILASPARRSQLLKLIGIAGAAVAFMVLMFYGIRALAGVHNPTLLDRLWMIPQFLANPSGDVSYQERIAQARLAWDAFLSQPVFGVGPGHRFLLLDPYGPSLRTFSLDTTLSYLAKFGLIGAIALVAVGWAWLGWIRRLHSEGSNAVMRGAFISYLVVLGFLFPLAAPLEDKGLSFGLLFLLLVAAERLHESDRREQIVPNVPSLVGITGAG